MPILQARLIEVTYFDQTWVAQLDGCGTAQTSLEHHSLMPSGLHSSLVFKLLVGLCRREALFKQISQKARFLLRVLNDFGEASLFVKLVFVRDLVGRMIPARTCMMLANVMLAKVRSLSFRVIRSRRIVEFTDSRPLISLLHHGLVRHTFRASSLHLASVQVSFDARYTLLLVTTRLVQLEFVYVEFLFVRHGATILDRHGVLRLLESILVIEGHIPLAGIPLRFLWMGRIEHAETVPGCVQRGSLLR